MLFAGLILGLALTVFAFSRSYLLSIVMMIFHWYRATGHLEYGTIIDSDSFRQGIRWKNNELSC